MSEPFATPLDELISLLEGAKSGTRELDCRVFEAIGGTEGEWFGSKITGFYRSPGGEYTFNTEDGYRHLQATYASHYTTRVDDALAIVPRDGSASLDWTITKRDRYPYQGEWRFEATIWNGPNYQGFANTAPIAVCIVALKARRGA